MLTLDGPKMRGGGYSLSDPPTVSDDVSTEYTGWPTDSGEKIALGVTVLLAFSVFMLAIAEKMPETSESIPLIGN